MRIIVVLSSALLLLCSCGIFYTTTRVAPVRLTVVDSETGLPLSDITVYHAVTKGRSVGLGHGEYYIIAVEKLMTDTNGQIVMPEMFYSHRSWPSEWISSRTFFINLDTYDNRKPTRFDLTVFSSTISNERLLRDTILANEAYFATVAYVWSSLTSELRDTDRATGRNFRRYDFEGLFSREEVQITVTLVRNR